MLSPLSAQLPLESVLPAEWQLYVTLYWKKKKKKNNQKKQPKL